MKILFLATNLPVPPNNGQSMRSLSIIRCLWAIGHKVSFLSFCTYSDPPDLSPLSTFCTDISVVKGKFSNLSRGKDYVRRLTCLLRGKPYAVERFRSDLMKRKIQEKLAAEHFDLIICDGIYTMGNLGTTNIPIAMNCHNIEHVILERYAQIEKDPLKRRYALLESKLLRGMECEGWRRSTLAMVCSSIDKEILKQLNSDLPTFIVPNAVDTDLFRTNESWPPEDSSTILFQGGMDWFPNRDAVEFFARCILPLIALEIPRIQFVVAGRNPEPQFVAEMSELGHLHFTGTVPDMRPYLAAAAVVVVPLRIGGGTRIKILEACAAGKPVVSTRIGAEGLNLKPGTDILIADNPQDFARCVLSLLQDASERERVASSARSAILENNSLPALKKSLDEAISTQTVAKSSKPSL